MLGGPLRKTKVWRNEDVEDVASGWGDRASPSTRRTAFGLFGVGGGEAFTKGTPWPERGTGEWDPQPLVM